MCKNSPWRLHTSETKRREEHVGLCFCFCTNNLEHGSGFVSSIISFSHQEKRHTPEIMHQRPANCLLGRKVHAQNTEAAKEQKTTRTLTAVHNMLLWSSTDALFPALASHLCALCALCGALCALCALCGAPLCALCDSRCATHSCCWSECCNHIAMDAHVALTNKSIHSLIEDGDTG